MTTTNICNIEPFRYQSTPQPMGDAAASGAQINDQFLEDYLNRLRAAICTDIENIIAECCNGGGGGGAETFLELTDTPSSYAGQATKMVVVNGAENALVFQDQPAIPTNDFVIQPRLAQMVGPSGVTTAFGPPVSASGAGQLQIGNPPSTHADAYYRVGITAASTTNAANALRATVFLATIGNAATRGGARLVWRFSVELYSSGARGFVGFYPAVATIPGTSNPSSLTDIIALAYDDSDSNWHIMHNDNVGTATRVDTGIPVAAGDALEVIFSFGPAATSFTYAVRNLATGTEFSGTANSDLPQSTARLIYQLWVGSAASAANQRLAHIFMALEVGVAE